MLSIKFDTKQPTNNPGIAAVSTNGNNVNPSAILSCIGPKAKISHWNLN